MKPGDIVSGRSLMDPKVRQWVVLTEPTRVPGGIIIGQNVRARTLYRHALCVDEVTVTGERDENWHRFKGDRKPGAR